MSDANRPINPLLTPAVQGLAVGMFAVVVALWPAAVLAVVLFLVARRFLGHREGWLLVAGSTVAFFLNAGPLTGEWLSWWFYDVALGQAGPRGGALVRPPWAPTLVAGLGFAGLLLALTGTRIAGRVQQLNPLHHDKILEGQGGSSILPTLQQKQKVTLAQPPGGLTPKLDDHTITHPDLFGKRGIPLGLDSNGTPVSVTEDELQMHAMIFGSTGSGKTETIKALAGALLDLGWFGHVLDLKEDTKPGGLRDFCYEYATFHAIPYQELRLSDPAPSHWFNPLASMGPDEVRDTILALQTFDDGYWQSINKQMLGQLVNLFHYAHEIDPDRFPQATMYDLGKVLSHGEGMGREKSVRQMLATVIDSTDELSNEDFHTILRPASDHAKSAAGFGARLTAVYETQAGRTALRPGGTKAEYDITLPGLGYIGLDSQGKFDLSNVVATAFLQRTSVWAAQRTTGVVRDRAQRFLIIDEGSVLNRQVVHSILTKARSAGITVVLCSQSPLDFETGQKDAAGFSALAQNANVMVFMSQGEPEAAEICAEFIGKEDTYESQMRFQGGTVMSAGSIRKEQNYKVEPDDLRRLGIGEAILRVGKPQERISWVSVKMRSPRAAVH
jgi:energy-coupling factor transporter ATP-binding protein EcfA2